MSSYGLKLKEMLKHKIRQALVFNAYDWTVKICELCMTVTMLTYGAHLVATGQTSSGDFISFVIYQLTLATCLEGLTSVYTGLMNAAGKYFYFFLKLHTISVVESCLKYISLT